MNDHIYMYKFLTVVGQAELKMMKPEPSYWHPVTRQEAIGMN